MTPDPAEMIEPPLPPRRLSADLEELLAHADGKAMTIAELEAILRGRGVALMVLVFSLPFVLPVPLPGLSVVFGMVIMFVGVRIGMGRKPSLPGFILQRQIKYSLLKKIVGAGLRFCKLMEKVARPRMDFLQKWPGMLNLIGLGIASGGFLLALPLPPLIPASNTVPAISVLLLTAGMMERDGLLVLVGYVANLGAYVYFAIWGYVYRELIKYAWEHFILGI